MAIHSADHLPFESEEEEDEFDGTEYSTNTGPRLKKGRRKSVARPTKKSRTRGGKKASRKKSAKKKSKKSAAKKRSRKRKA